MASSKIMMVMSLIILVFLFGGLMMGFILQSQGVLDEQSGRIVVNNDATMAQLATHVALRAYNCNGEGGGQYDIIESLPVTESWKGWEDWQSYMTQAKNNLPDSDAENPSPSSSYILDFEELNNSKLGRLQCSGTASTLPFQDKTYLQGLNNIVSRDHWGNDQEGRYGRMKFEFNETVWIGRSETPATYMTGCWGFNINRNGPGDHDGITDMRILITDETQPNVFDLNLRGDVGNNIEDKDCTAIADGTSHITVVGSNGAQGGPLITLTLIDLNPNDRRSGPDYYTDGNGNVINQEAFRICKGAKGYIQGNTGPARWDNSGSGVPPYSIENPPGKHGEQVGGTAKKDNNVRLFAVFTQEGNC